MARAKNPNTAAATTAVIRKAQEAKAADLRAAGWGVDPPEIAGGWYVWLAAGAEKWRAVPAPAGMAFGKVVGLPGQIGARTLAGLHALMHDRYGWHDTCESCGVLARKCGHRQPEREDARTAH